MEMSPEAALTDAIALHGAGQVDAAKSRLEALVRNRPGFVDARITLGRVYWQQNEVQPALAQFRRAAEASQGHPQAWGIYISALVEAGKKDRAKKMAMSAHVSGRVRKELLSLIAGSGATQPDPDPAQAAISNVASLIRDGKFADARSAADQALGAYPKSAALLRLRGAISLAMEDPAAAEPFLRRALALDPRSVDAIANLGLCLTRQARPMEAIAVLEAVPDGVDITPEIRVNLASAYTRAGLWDRAIQLTDDLLDASQADPEVLAIRAEAMIEAGRPEEALQALDVIDVSAFPDLRALAVARAEGPAAAEAFLAGLPECDLETEFRLANTAAEIGFPDQAIQRARKIADLTPDDPRPFRAIGLFGKWTLGDPLIDPMRDEAVRSDADPGHRGRFGLALGKALIDTGEPESGFEALRTANAELRSIVNYDPQAMTRELEDIANTWDARTIARLSRAGDTSVAPIFIIGLPRSGSTLIENVLSLHSDVQAFGEWPVCGGVAGPLAANARAGSVRDLASEVTPLIVSKAAGKPRVTDKLLSNFFVAGLLAAAFPKAVFVEAARDLRAIGLSMFENPLNAASHPYSLDLAELGQFAVGYARLMAHWQSALGPRFHRCSYEDLVTEPEPAIRALLEAVGLPFEAACLTPEQSDRRVNTLSVAQVRRPLHAASTERWRTFEPQLKPLIDRLSDADLV